MGVASFFYGLFLLIIIIAIIDPSTEEVVLEEVSAEEDINQEAQEDSKTENEQEEMVEEDVIEEESEEALTEPEEEVMEEESEPYEPTTLSGTGDDVVFFDVTVGGLVTFDMSNTGGGHFAMVVHSEDGDRIGSVSNTTVQNFSGQGVHGLEEGTYMLEVSSSGNWNVTIIEELLTLNHGSILQTGETYEGKGPMIVGPFAHEKNAYVIEAKYSDGGHFAIVGQGIAGNRLGSVVNTTDPYDGKGLLNLRGENYFFYLEVKAEGSWTFTIE
jgi:Na+-transporting methylmalonyl-CoA/oxaloacetate decarboxylase gamma subunit